MKLDPYKAVGPIEFGMGSDDVKAAMDTTGEAFDKDGVQVEDFDSAGLQVHYGDGGGVEFVDTFGPATLEWEGLELAHGASVEELLGHLEERDLEVVERSPRLWVVPELGAALWSEDGEQVETAGAFATRDYYED